MPPPPTPSHDDASTAVAPSDATSTSDPPAIEDPLGANELTVVAVGASAGGLDALERLFRGLPDTTGAAFVVVQHLSPDHKSMMVSLLSRHTPMPVRVAEEAMLLAPNTITLIPPGAMMRLEGLRLRLRPKIGNVLHLPIDEFLISLANEVGPRAVGVILSGTGSDGTRGARSIHGAGGLVIAQDPEDARFDGMPRSVIATGLVDAVLPVDHIAERLVAHIDRSIEPVGPAPLGRATAGDTTTPTEAMAGILEVLLQHGGIDFRRYKPGTVHRRIERRMAIRHAAELRSYLRLLEDEPEEKERLQRELLIPVTSFFRDVEAFEALRELVVDPLVQDRSVQGPIRVWSAGTSTGEEAYSLAMLFLDAFEQHQRWPGLKVFATDVSASSIQTGASGTYPASAAAELPERFLERFFAQSGDLLTVRSELRQAIVFARHNLLSDPPFTRMDLVVCRNTLIYFDGAAQELVLRKLQYALRPGRHLFLGPSESVGRLQDDFITVSPRHRILQVRRSAPQLLATDLRTRAASVTVGRRFLSIEHTEASSAPSAAERGRAMLLRQYGPPAAILVNEAHDVVHSYGDIDRILAVRPGAASLSLHRLVPAPLTAVCSALLQRSRRDKAPQTSGPVRLASPDGSGSQDFRLTVLPVDTEDASALHLLIFETIETRDDLPPVADIDVPTAHQERVRTLEAELAATRETLQSTIEELETANEELQATNEEMMASNEELQSSNEELQSVNEELNTVNAEYQEKLEVLNRVNADLDSLTQVVSSGAVFVDEQLRLTRFNPDAALIFRVRPEDVGRPLSDLTHSLDYPSLHEDLQRTLDRFERVETEVAGTEGKRYLVQMLPYRVPSSTRRGAVLSVIDRTESRTAKSLQSVVDGLAEHIAVLDLDGRIRLVNEGWIRFARENGDPDLKHSGVGVNYLDVCAAHPNLPDATYAARAHKGILSVLQGRLSHFTMQYPCDAPNEARWFVMHVRPLTTEPGGAVISHINVSEWRFSEREEGEG
jgi:two-component system CheB/CheR fusion protein